MKTKLNYWGLGWLFFLVVFTVAGYRSGSMAAKADNPHKTPPSAIYVHFKATPGPRITNEFGINVPEIGLEVRWVSRSQTSPEIPVGYPAGEVIAFLHGQGYVLHWLSADKVVGIK